MKTPALADEMDEEHRSDAVIEDALRSRAYVAFQSLPGRTKPRPRLLFVPRRGMWEWLNNGALWRIRAKPDGTQIGLSYHTAAVILEGTGLTGAAFSIDRHNCLFLQQFDPERHEPPKPGQPVITAMRFFVPADDAPEKNG